MTTPISSTPTPMSRRRSRSCSATHPRGIESPNDGSDPAMNCTLCSGPGRRLSAASRQAHSSLLLALSLTLLVSHGWALAPPVAPARSAFETPLAADNLDPAAFSEWVEGAEKPVQFADG